MARQELLFGVQALILPLFWQGEPLLDATERSRSAARGRNRTNLGRGAAANTPWVCTIYCCGQYRRACQQYKRFTATEPPNVTAMVEVFEAEDEPRYA